MNPPAAGPRNAPPRLPPILRSKLIAGLVILIPIIVTAKALIWLFSYLDELAQDRKSVV